MEGYLNAISVPAIAAIAFVVINVIRRAVGQNDKFDRFIPLVAAGIGVICGVVCYFAVPDIMPADNVVVAIVIGGASGLSATGTHQIVKQLGKSSSEKTDPESNENE